MNPQNPLTGTPIQNAPMFVPAHQAGPFNRQRAFGPTVDPDMFLGDERRRAPVTGGRGMRQRRQRVRTGGGYANAADLERAQRYEFRHVERIVDNTITNPAFWGTVFRTLQNNADVAEEIRRDLDQQELRAAQDRDRARRNNRSTRSRTGSESRSRSPSQPPGESVTDERDEGLMETEEDARMQSDASGVGGGEGDEDRRFARPTRPEELPDLYEAMGRGFENLGRTVGGVQRLDLLMEELEVDALWSHNDVMISFGAMARVLLRLFAGPYETEEENMIVRMLNLGVERAARTLGFEEYRAAAGGRERGQEPFVVTYRRRGRVLRDFAAFRYMLEVAERMGRVGRKHKNDLVLLYLTLTTPEVRLHRKMNANDRENVLAFRDRVTGYTIATPPIMAKPMSIEMHLDSVFGNVSSNTRLLERSLVAAMNNRHRKTAGQNAAREVESLLENAHLLDLSTTTMAGRLNGSGSSGGGGGVGTDASLLNWRPYTLEKNEHAALRHMLESSVVVSMMAEEFRVFVAGAPASRSNVGSCVGNTRSDSNRHNTTGVVNSKYPRHHNQQQRRQVYLSRRPIFFTFKPISQAMTNKD